MLTPTSCHHLCPIVKPSRLSGTSTHADDGEDGYARDGSNTGSQGGNRGATVPQNDDADADVDDDDDGDDDDAQL
eukprot:2731079-Pyramimonas_sp.AAC.1